MREGDELVGVRHSSGDDDILMISKLGQAIRFHEKEVRAMGRDTSGVAGMRMRGDHLLGRCQARQIDRYAQVRTSSELVGRGVDRPVFVHVIACQAPVEFVIIED